MKREEFLNSLRIKLQGLPPEDIEDRISFYYEMIDDMMDEGKTEEEAVAEIGSVDDVVYDIAQDTPLAKIVKERIKPKRKLAAWEVVLLILGFPLWFPLALVAVILTLVAYILFWVFVIVAYAIEASLIVGSVAFLVASIANAFNGGAFLPMFGMALLCAGGGTLFFFGCWYITKGTIYLHKKLFTAIKAKFIKKGAK